MICNNCRQLEQRGLISGQAFTDWTCLKCGREDIHPNTGVPKICKNCSEEYNLCESCGQPVLKSFQEIQEKLKELSDLANEMIMDPKLDVNELAKVHGQAKSLLWVLGKGKC